METIRWCLLNLLKSCFLVHSESWIAPNLKHLNFIPFTITYRTVLPIFPYWKIIRYCDVLPKTSANGIPCPQKLWIELDRKIRNYESLWNGFPYLKPHASEFHPIHNQHFHTDKPFCVVMCCPKPQPMECHPPKSYPERWIALDLDWTENLRNYGNLWNSLPYLKPLNFIPSPIIYRTVLLIFSYWKAILCCHVLPKTSANGVPSPKMISGNTNSFGSRLDRNP